MGCTGLKGNEPPDIAVAARRLWSWRAFGESDAILGVALSLLLHASIVVASSPLISPTPQDERDPIAVELVLAPPAAAVERITEMADTPVRAAPRDQAIVPPEQQAEMPRVIAEPVPDFQPLTLESSAVEPVDDSEDRAAPVVLPIPVMPPKISHDPTHPTPKLAAATPLAPPASVTPSAEASTGTPEPTPQQVAAVPPAARTIDAASAKEALGQYAARLRGFIEAHKSYPPQAVMRHEEGTVRLRIIVDQDGRLVEVTVLSAASPHLVEASVQATKAAAPFPSLPKELNAQRATFELPITFRLE